MNKISRGWFALLLLAVVGSVAFARGAAIEGEAPAITVILVRHAEKAVSEPPTSDPELSAAGERRATVLARLLSRAGVSQLFATEYKRTQATLAPLAAVCELEVEVVAAREPDELLSALRALPAGSVAVIAGHSNTVPGLVAALGGRVEGLVQHATYGGMLGDAEYDRLFMLSAPTYEQGGAVTIELRFGEESPR